MIVLSSNPARSFDDARARITQMQAQDDETIHPKSRTKFLSHGAKTARAVLLLHGYTDSAHQFGPLGDLLFEQGYNVLTPRLPYHGYQDRMTDAHGQFAAAEMLEWTNAVTDIAVGLGNTLTVMGLSLGGVLATWVAEQRGDVERVLIIAPAYGTTMIPMPLTVPVAQLLKRLPNLFMWWDPRVREGAGFDYTYPRFATRTLAQLFLLGNDFLKQARAKAPAARAVWMITNANDLAVSNKLCGEFVAAWRTHDASQIHTYEYPRELNIPHDILDPNDPAVKPKIVYPPLLEIVQQPL
jgi:alpha-beta hydrolase superfamily lysophospholipase